MSFPFDDRDAPGGGYRYDLESEAQDKNRIPRHLRTETPPEMDEIDALIYGVQGPRRCRTCGD